MSSLEPTGGSNGHDGSSHANDPQRMRELYRQVAKHNDTRFLIDLEFVECLADPNYILSLHPYLENPAFLNYIKYLLYFKRPEYVIYVQYPHAVFFLEQLLVPEFRLRLRHPDYCALLRDQCEEHLKHGRRIEYDEFVQQMTALEEQEQLPDSNEES